MGRKCIETSNFKYVSTFLEKMSTSYDKKKKKKFWNAMMEGWALTTEHSTAVVFFWISSGFVLHSARRPGTNF